MNEKEKDQQMMAQEVQNNIQLVNTYAEIVKVLELLMKYQKLHHKYSSNELTGMLKVSNQDETQLLNIAIDSNNDKDSEKIANTFAKVFSKEVPEIMSVDNVSILSSAKGTSEQVEPKTIMNLVLGLVLGMIVALLIITFKELFDKRIKNEEDVKKNLIYQY